MKRKLETTDLVRALTRFGDRYRAVDVFADDLSSAATDAIRNGKAVTDAGVAYRYRVFPQGVVRLERVESSAVAQGAVAGAALGTAIAAASEAKGDGVLGGALLGLLIGGVLGAATEKGASRRVFAMQFDPDASQWTAYDGELLRWMKDQLLSSAPAASAG